MKKNFKKFVAVAVMGAVMSSGASAFADSTGICLATANGMDFEVALQSTEKLRAGWVRDSFEWGSCTYIQENGEYVINPQSAEKTKEYYSELKSKGIKTVMILGYGSTASQFGNDNRFNIPSPENEAYWNGWQEYVKMIATEFKGLVDVYEVWNEQDHEPFNAAIDNDSTSEDAEAMAAYATLLKQTYKDVKSIDEDVIVTPGGFIHGDTYIDDFLNAVGSDKCFDAFAVHAYNHGDYSKIEEVFGENLNEYDAILDKYGYDCDIYMTENGWFTGNLSNSVTAQEQAAAFIKNKVVWDSFLADNNRGGEYIWYCGVDTGNDPANAENNFGLVDYRGDYKIAGKAAKTLNALIGDKEFVSLEESSSGLLLRKSTYKAKYENSDTGALTYIIWGDGTKVNIPGGEVFNADGSVSGEASAEIITNNDNPKFVTTEGSGTSITDAYYNPQTGMIVVQGRAYNAEGDIEIYATVGDEEEIVYAVQDEFGYFKAEISAPASGDVEVYANYEGYTVVTVEGVGVSEDAETVTKSELKGTAAMYNSNTNTVTVSATFANCAENEAVKVLVVPYDVEEITEDNIIYIDEFKVQNGENTQFTFNLPENTAKGKYTVYLRLTNSDKASDVIYNNLIEVSSFVYGTENTTITAKASGLGYDEALVEKAVIIIAQYDSKGRLVDTKISDGGITGDEKTFTAQIAEGASNVQAMLLKDMTTLMPLAEIAVLQD